jgi:glycosyltransferase involved in cell wall biosynthesis
MKICMVAYGLEEFGGLEEIIKELAAGLQAQGQAVSVLSAAWTPPENQYVRSFAAHGIAYVQPPRWLSHAASHWPAKERIVAACLWLAAPLIYLLAAGRWLRQRDGWNRSRTASRNWLRGQLMEHVIGPDRRALLAWLLLDWWRLTWRFDVLHLHGYTNKLLFALDWAERRRVPVVYEEHSTPNRQFDWWQGYARRINKATVVVAVSAASAEALRNVCGVKRPIAVIPCPVADPANPSAVNPSAANPSATGKPVCLTTIARLDVVKGLRYLLAALVEVRRRWPEATLRIYGDGPLRAELPAYAQQLGLDPGAIFAGAFAHHDLSAILRRADIFVLPSLSEGLPLVIVEAMAHGCPIVATAVGGVPELIEHEANGLLCAAGDAGQLAQALARLIEDGALRTRLGQEARRTYLAGPFQPATVTAMYVTLYQQVLSSNPVDLRCKPPPQHRGVYGKPDRPL